MIFFKKKPEKIVILGGGSYGTALATVISHKQTVYLWTNEIDVADEILTHKTNRKYLKKAQIPENVIPTIDIEWALDGADMVLFVVPSQATREVAEIAKQYVKKNAIIVSCAKGLEEGTELRMSKVLSKIFPITNPIVVLSGPTLADELAMGVPTTIVAASTIAATAKIVQETLSMPTFRIYTTNDVVGVELGGVLKNIIALAAGINDDLGFGANSRAGLITRGLVEMIRFAKKQWAKNETLLGLSGLGDLIVTCNSPLSRNYTLGHKIGKGMPLENALSEMTSVCEGVKATRVVYEISRKKKIIMPITHEVYRILFERKNPKQAVKDLMTRSSKSEKIL